MKAILRVIIPIILLPAAFAAGFYCAKSSCFKSHPGAPFNSGRHPFEKSGELENPAEIKQRMLNRLTERLDLSKDQQEKIESILSSKMIGASEIRKKFHSKMKQRLEEINSEIEQVLDDRQKEEFKIMKERFKKRSQRPAKH